MLEVCVDLVDTVVTPIHYGLMGWGCLVGYWVGIWGEGHREERFNEGREGRAPTREGGGKGERGGREVHGHLGTWAPGCLGTWAPGHLTSLGLAGHQGTRVPGKELSVENKGRTLQPSAGRNPAFI